MTERSLKASPDGNDIDALVQEMRLIGRVSIQQTCGMMRVLDMSQPIELNDIYTKVNILEKITGRQRLQVADLLKESASEFECPGLGRIAQDRLNGLEAVKKYSKLIVLGKPGSGKTTFLQHVALKCSNGELQANLVPIFIKLKEFAETEQQPSLLEYITRQFSTYITDTAFIEKLLSQAKVLVLLDGLDEVRETDSERVLRSVHSFSTKFHGNHFVITCRIAARKYTFEQFTEVEVADFDSEQIDTFATNWFASIDPTQGKRFIQKLTASSRIQELATCPLLLTLLCFVFECSSDFPSNRSELYKEGLNLLLKKWDAKRNIEREQVYKQLSVQHKEDLLSKIALITFERGDYFFRQQEIEQQIADYIWNLPGVNTGIEALQLDSEAVLKSIEAQHGLLVERAQRIYSFSHLTFQEYFTAREIVTNSAPQALDLALKHLVSRITEKRWREVCLLSVSMLRSCDYLLQLMKRHIDALVAGDSQLQAFLTWVRQKSYAVPVRYNLVTVRAFYLDLELTRTLDLVGGTLAHDLDRGLVSGTLNHDLALALALVHDHGLTRPLAHVLAHDRVLTLTLDRDLNHTLALALALIHDPAFTLELALELALTHDRALAHKRILKPELEYSLQQLKEQLPDPDKDRERFQAWWKTFGGAWAEKLRAAMIKYRNIGHDWQFSKKQQEQLRQYYDTNKLLVDCLNSNCYVTQAVRDQILETLLLPTVEVKQ